MSKSPKVSNTRNRKSFRQHVFEIIFEAETPAGKFFDIFLIALIVFSVIVVMLESVNSIQQRFGNELMLLEWIITLLFTIEYILRIYCVKKPWKYITSTFGIIDLISILPTYLFLFFPAGHFLTVVRILRLLRIFRLFKLTQYLQGRNIIIRALKESRYKIVFFLSFVLLMVTVIGSVMYVVEANHPESGFTSIPESIYWAIVTLTTVGYGDISPITPLGKFLASLVMIMGYSIIAVPTGIVSAEMARMDHEEAHLNNTETCPSCGDIDHHEDADFCKSCGHSLAHF